MANIIEDLVGWINDSFGTAFEVSSHIGTPEYYLVLGAVLALFAMFGFYLCGTLGNRPRLSILLAGAVVSVGFGVLIESWTNLVDWLILGFEFTEPGPSIFAVGFTAFLAVMLWNMIRTKGDKLVL